MIEIYKMKHTLNPSFMRNVFTERSNKNNLRSENHLQLPTAKTISYGIENIQYRVCLLWSTLPEDIKDSNTLSEFTRKSFLDLKSFSTRLAIYLYASESGNLSMLGFQGV